MLGARELLFKFKKEVVKIKSLRPLYLALDNPAYSNVFVERLLKTTRHLPQFPQSGRPMPEAKAPNIREVLYQGYRIVYRLSPELIEVVMAVHGSRNLGGQENNPWDSN